MSKLGRGGTLLIALWLAAGLVAGLVAGATHGATERTRQKTQAEAERVRMQQKLGSLKQEINRLETARDEAADILADSEQAISDANRVLHDLTQEQRQTEQKLRQLALEQKRLTDIVTQQQARLGKLLRQHYVAGREDRLKLLLSGDNPNRIERDLQYMGYLSKAQAGMLASLRANLAAVEQNQELTQNTQDELAEIVQEQQQQKLRLEQEKAKRRDVLGQVSHKLQEQRKEAGNLERDQQRMAALVERLGKLIAEQAKEEQRRAEQRRLAQVRATEQAAQAAREARARDARMAQASSPTSGKITPPRPEPSQRALATSEPELKNEQVPSGAPQEGNFASMRGKLRLPLRGAISSKFGTKRPEGPSSKGLFIRAAEGSEVKAVANGQVVFADWLRGFGNLLIIDHGGHYLTLYGNNQSLLKRAGDAVKNGDTIAYAGSSGGNEESGLYFEMRHQTRVFDPLSWINLK